MVLYTQTTLLTLFTDEVYTSEWAHMSRLDLDVVYHLT